MREGFIQLCLLSRSLRNLTFHRESLGQLGIYDRSEAFYECTRSRCKCGSVKDLVKDELVKISCKYCYDRLRLMKVTEVCRTYGLKEDDLEYAQVQIACLPNPYFKHMPMKMTYLHLVEPKLNQMRSQKQFVRQRRKQLEQPKLEAAKELRYKEKKHAAKDYLSRIKRQDFIDHPEVETHLQQ